MRGQKLFNNILPVNNSDKCQRKGRNDVLIEQRNNCMLARYYYYSCIRAKKYDEILSIIVKEFFLSPSRISKILLDKLDDIKKMKENGISVYQLQNLWPQFKW